MLTSSFFSIRSIGVVPFPGLSIVVGESLAPNRHFGICFIPFEDYNNGPSYLVIFAKEQADAVAERTYYGRIQRPAIAVDPI